MKILIRIILSISILVTWSHSSLNAQVKIERANKEGKNKKFKAKSEKEDFYDLFQKQEENCGEKNQFLRASNFDQKPKSDWLIQSNTTRTKFVNNPNQPGCKDQGFVKMYAGKKGRTKVYSSISQKTILPLKQSKLYQMSMCIKTKSADPNLRIKVYAFNGNPPATFKVNSTTAIIGVSGIIANTNNDWVKFEFPTWEANKNFNSIAIVVEAETSDEKQKKVEELAIDNVCLVQKEKMEEEKNYGFSYTECDSLVYPTQLVELIKKHNIKVTETETEIQRGSLFDLYGHQYDVSTDLWYADHKLQNFNMGVGITNFEKCDSIYSQLDTIGILKDSLLIDSINNYIDPFVASRTFANSMVGNFSQTTPLNPPTNSGCLHFDGVDDYIKFNQKVTNQIGAGDFTIELTVRPDYTQNSNKLVLMSNHIVQTSGSSGPGLPQLIHASGFRILLIKNNGIYNLAIQQAGFGTNSLTNGAIFSIQNNGTKGNIIDGDCHQLVISRNVNTLNFYIDGDFIGSKSINPMLLPSLSLSSPSNIVLGNDDTNLNAFKGSIYDVRIWDKARTNTDIANTGRTKRFSYTEKGLIANFELLNIQGQTFHNTAYNSYTATLGSSGGIDAQDPSASGNCCDSFDPACTGGFVEDNTKPFGGRSIVYVHGLILDHIFEPHSVPAKYTGQWPFQKEDFYVGDYKDRAVANWDEQIIRELGSETNPSNNYLVTSFPCNQRLPFGVSALIAQIKDAIETGRGVVWADGGNSNSDCRKVFGEEIVIISHSTGGLVTSTLLGLGEMSGTVGLSRNLFGNFKPITDRMKVHIGFNPALSGSPLARVALAVSRRVGTSTALVNKFWKEFGLGRGWNIAGALNPLFSHNTILVDLEPFVANVVWGNFTYHKATCKTVTSASAYPGFPRRSFREAFAAKNIIPGLDDGVLQMDCQCARKKIIPPYTIPSRFVKRPNLLGRNFDMGNQVMYKSYGMWREMSRPIAPGLLGNGCISGKTPTGMLTWKLNDGSNPPRWPNHYSLFQGTGYHYDAWDLDVYGKDYYLGEEGHIPMYEESRVITDPTIYDLVSGTNTPLVNSKIKNGEEEVVRKKTIGFHFLGNYYEIIIWKRTYHLMKDYRNNDAVSYMYKYVLRK